MNENEEPLVTEAELARVLELDAKATQGPYAVYEHEDHSGICIGPPYRESWMRGKGDPGFRTDDVCRISGGRRDGVTEQQRHDAALIAEYRTLAPRLARELAAARAAMDKAGAVFISMNLSQSSDWPKLLPDIREAERAINAALNTHTHE